MSKAPQQNTGKFAIVDIETTGGSFKRDRIIEVAIIIHDGKNEIERFESLVNPEVSIPPFISKLTGIHQDMVEDAPYFYEIAKEIVLLTEGCIFVAHNVKFDYGFIRYEFERLGYTYSRKRLCTVKLARQRLELPSYGMDQLIQYFNIEIKDRHRAMGDAEALSYMFPSLIVTGKDDKVDLPKLLREDIKEHQLPEGISFECYTNLPQDAGVYYMLDEEGHPVYIGKSNNIKKRIYQHFSQKKKSVIQFDRLVKGFRYELTGSTLIAELKEAAEIKKYLPILNRAQRNNRKHYFSYLKHAPTGHLVVSYDEMEHATKDNPLILRYHTTKKSAAAYVRSLVRSLGLCNCIQKGIFSEYFSCIHDQLENCDRHQHLEPETYNEKFEALRSKKDQYPLRDGVVFIDSSFYKQTDYLLFEQGIYRGFGTLNEAEDTIQDREGFMEYMVPQEETLDVIKILKIYFQKRGNRLRKIEFPSTLAKH